MTQFYDDSRYGAEQVLSMRSIATLGTTVIASQTTIARHTFMKAVTVTDCNLRVLAGDTQTSGFTTFSISKSVAGTGSLTAVGTVALSTNADNSVVDGSVTVTNFNVGDDIVFCADAGTALPAGSGMRADMDVLYKLRYVE